MELYGNDEEMDLLAGMAGRWDDTPGDKCLLAIQEGGGRVALNSLTGGARLGMQKRAR